MLRLFYHLTLVVAVVSGFFQMPLAGRYGLATTFGFGWTGQSFFLNQLHLWAVVMLFFFSPIVIMQYVHVKTVNRNSFIRPKTVELTLWGMLRCLLLFLLLCTGSIRFLINNEIVGLPWDMFWISLSHVIFGMVFIFINLVCLFTGRYSYTK